MNLPDKQSCFELLREMQMPAHIVVHSLQVCRVAVLLTDHLKPVNPSLNRKLVQAAALLHDITKNRSFETKENHALTGARFLTDRQFPEVARLVRQHVRLDHYSSDASIGAAAIINYADKRVLHDKIVSLDERMQYILERYGDTARHQQRIRKLWRITTALESRIFSQVAIAPDDLPALLGDDGIAADLQEYRRASTRLK